MADPPRHSDRGKDTDAAPNGGSTTDTPRWVKTFGIVAVVVILAFVVLLIAQGPGGHGPGRHTSHGGMGSPSATVAEGHPLQS
jgi:hypothetical protein